MFLKKSRFQSGKNDMLYVVPPQKYKNQVYIYYYLFFFFNFQYLI